MLNWTGPPAAVSMKDPVYGPWLADASCTVVGAAATVPGLGDGDADGDRDRLADGDGRGCGELRRGTGAVLAAGLVVTTSAGVLAGGVDGTGADGTGLVLGAVLPGPGAAADGLASGLRLASAISGAFAWCSRSAANTAPPPSSSTASTATPAATA